jgi:hypothetical protein
MRFFRFAATMILAQSVFVTDKGHALGTTVRKCSRRTHRSRGEKAVAVYYVNRRHRIYHVTNVSWIDPIQLIVIWICPTASAGRIACGFDRYAKISLLLVSSVRCADVLNSSGAEDRKFYKDLAMLHLPSSMKNINLYFPLRRRCMRRPLRNKRTPVCAPAPRCGETATATSPIAR